MFVLPEAFLFLAASLWLLVATGGPGGGAVRRAVQQLRGTGGQPKTVPALLLLPVLGLWEEACANPLWYGAGSAMWQVLGIAITVGGVVLVLRRPRVAAVAAVRRADRPRPRPLISALRGAEGFISATPRARSPASGRLVSIPPRPACSPGCTGPSCC